MNVFLLIRDPELIKEGEDLKKDLEPEAIVIWEVKLKDLLELNKERKRKTQRIKEKARIVIKRVPVTEEAEIGTTRNTP